MLDEVVHVVRDGGDGDVVVVLKIQLLSSMMLLVTDCVGERDVDVFFVAFFGEEASRTDGGKPFCRKSL